MNEKNVAGLKEAALSGFEKGCLDLKIVLKVGEAPKHKQDLWDFLCQQEKDAFCFALKNAQGPSEIDDAGADYKDRLTKSYGSIYSRREVEKFKNDVLEKSRPPIIRTDRRELRLNKILVIMTGILIILEALRGGHFESLIRFVGLRAESTTDRTSVRPSEGSESGFSVYQRQPIEEALDRSSFSKFRVLFSPESTSVKSARVQLFMDRTWQPSQFDSLVARIKRCLSLYSGASPLRIAVTGHADDTPSGAKRKDELNRLLALARQEVVQEKIRVSLSPVDVSQILFTTPTSEWWNVDGYDARNSPGNNLDFRVALVEIHY